MKRISTLVMSLALLIGCGLPEQAEVPTAVKTEALTLAGPSSTYTQPANDDKVQNEQSLSVSPEGSPSFQGCSLEELEPCGHGTICAWKSCGESDSIEHTDSSQACGWCQSAARDYCHSRGKGVRRVYWK